MSGPGVHQEFDRLDFIYTTDEDPFPAHADEDHIVHLSIDTEGINSFIHDGTASNPQKFNLEINTQDKYGCVPLHLSNSAEFAQYLIYKGATVDVANNQGRTPLHYAVIDERLELAKVYLEYGANVNAPDGCGRRPLHMVRSAIMADLLIQNGADLNATDNYNSTVLHEAVKLDSYELVLALLRYKPNVNTRNYSMRSPLQDSQSGSICRLLLEYGADMEVLDNLGRSILHAAVDCRDKEKVEVLIEHGFDVNSDDKSGKTPLHIANEPVIVELLLKAGADINARDSSNTPVIHYYHPIGVIGILLENGCDVNIKDERDETVLHKEIALSYPDSNPAFQQRTIDLILLLLDYGADVKLVNGNGLTILEQIKYRSSTDGCSYYNLAKLVIGSIKLKVAGLPMSRRDVLTSTSVEEARHWLDMTNNEDFEQSHSQLESLIEEECEKEWEELASNKLSSGMSLQGVLRSSSFLYLSEKRLCGELRGCDYGSYPLYGLMLKTKIESNLLRCEACNSLGKLLKCIRGGLTLPGELMERILLQLADNELRRLTGYG